MNLLTCLDSDIVLMTSTFSKPSLIPTLLIIKLKYFVFYPRNWHFGNFSFKSCSISRSTTFYKCLNCSSSVLENTKMPYKYAMTNPCISLSTTDINCWKAHW